MEENEVLTPTNGDLDPTSAPDTVVGIGGDGPGPHHDPIQEDDAGTDPDSDDEDAEEQVLGDAIGGDGPGPHG